MWGERIRKKNSKNNDKINFIIPLLFLSVTIVLFTGAASAADIYVNGTGGNDDDPGTSWGTAKKTIYGGITAVGTGETVNIANGTYTGENNTGISIDRNMTLIGQSREGTIIDGENLSRIFTIKDGITVTLQNLTIQNGKTGYGAAIRSRATLNIINCTFTDNNATDYGGAIYNNGTLTVMDSIFTQNTAPFYGDPYTTYGGAIYNDLYLIIVGSTFTNNTAAFGGAIHNNGTLDVTNSNFTNNTADVRGGAIYSYRAGSMNVVDTNFTGNTANEYGGAIFNYRSGDLYVDSSTF